MVAVTGMSSSATWLASSIPTSERLEPRSCLHGLVAVVFSFFVAWIAAKGAGASTAVNLAINVFKSPR
jgi:hypothetical protein